MLKNKKEKAFCFTGPLAGPISSFFEEMRLSGYVYNEAGYYLRQIARSAEQEYLKVNCLTKEFVESWCQKREYESHKTWSSRVTMIRKLADYMDLRGLNTYKPSIMIPVKPSDFTPHIYTDSELKRFFEQAGLLPFYPNCPNRGPVASLLFRMLYGCGLRISEALNLTMKDVDLDRGVLAILDSKFGKSRYVPMSLSLTERCQQYAAHIRSEAPADAPFFPAPDGGHYSERLDTSPLTILKPSCLSRTGTPAADGVILSFSASCMIPEPVSRNWLT